MKKVVFLGLVIDCIELKESNLNTVDQLAALFPHWKKSSLQKKISNTLNGKDMRFIALNEGKIIGHIKVSFGKGLHKHRVELSSLVVGKDNRGEGVGTTLVEFVLKNMPKQISLVLLAVDSTNKPAIKLYKSLGFEQYGLLKRASFVKGKFVNNYLMKKDL